ncbi:MAG: diguanylate cyclase [Acidobacteria bacterium]|nr:diguanylate cyclase [Acidobacteriota bacterium]MBS1864963.1 diguanylate cyclase [Acidobacteriota bacterium]
MPSPGTPVELRSSSAASFLEIIVETLQPLDLSARAPFLRGFFRALTHLDISEEKSVQLWDEILSRKQSLSANLGQSVSLQTALVDVFTSSDLFRFPILIERDDLKKLEVSAVTDPLTGLSNRRLFQETFEKELNRAKRYAQPLSLVSLDLHRFKEVNDQLGHPRGDDVLRSVASTLSKSLRTSDAAFRIGGDEFALLLPQTDAAQALALSKRISVVFSEVLRPLNISVPVSLDHGVATFPMDADRTEELIQIADARLYRLKHANHLQQSQPEKDVSSSGPVQNSSSTIPTEVPGVPHSVSIPRPQQAPEKHETKSAQPMDLSPTPSPAAESTLAAAVSASNLRIHTLAASSGVPQPRPNYAVQRKAERVSMTGTNAYAVLGEASSRRAKVLDLGFGGVALELDSKQDLPESFLAVLHVPILPPVRVNLRPVWSRGTNEGSLRVGCCFIS